MKRSLLTVTGIATLALAMPGAALAHHGHGRHHNHHGARPHARHAKFRFVHIGSTATAPPPTPTTSTPATPPAPENAGTVASYTGGVLTLTLNDNSTVSGKVTNETRIDCVKATPTTPPSTAPGAEGPGDDNGQGDDQSRGDMSQQQGDQGEGQGQDERQHGDDGNDDGGPGGGEPEPPCDSSSLVPGAIVRAAELRIGPGGTEFESVLLVR